VLTNAKFISLAKGAGIAIVGALLTYATQVLSGQDLGLWGPIVAAGLAVAANFVRLLAQTPEPELPEAEPPRTY